MWDSSSSKNNELQRTTKALISLRVRAGWSAPLLFAHILRWVFSATPAIDQAQVALLLYGQLFNGVLIYTHWNIVSTFVRGWIRNWIVVKVTLSKTVRGNEEWQLESVINDHGHFFYIIYTFCLDSKFWTHPYILLYQTPCYKESCYNEDIVYM